MKIQKKTYSIVMCMLLIFTFLSCSGIATDETTPQIQDRRFDVKLFGILGGIPQRFFKSADILSVSFYEDSDQPDLLYVDQSLRDLSSPLAQLDTGYTVSWLMNGIRYCIVVHRLPSTEISSFVVGHSSEGTDDIVEWDTCEGIFNEKEHVITWIIEKQDIGTPSPFSTLTSLSSTAFIRRITDEGHPGADLFKDLTWNAKHVEDYNIKY